MNSNVVKVVKILSLVACVAGMIGSAWAGNKENKAILEDLVEKRFQNQ